MKETSDELDKKIDKPSESKPKAIAIRRGVILHQKPISNLSFWDLLVYNEKSLDKDAMGATSRAVGLANAQAWLVGRCYTFQDKPLNPGLLTQLKITAHQLNKLVAKLLEVDAEITIHDDEMGFSPEELDGVEVDCELLEEEEEGDYQTSNDFEVDGKRIKFAAIPWQFSSEFQRKYSKSPAKLFADACCKFVTINDEKVTMEQIKSPEGEGGIGIKIGRLILNSLVKKLL